MIRNALLVLAIVAQPVLAHAGEPAVPVPKNGGDEILRPPPTYKANHVTVDEQLGAKVPLDAMFRDHTGKLVTLGQVLTNGKLTTTDEGTLPTILTFNYSDCPMLCNLQLNGLSAVLPKIAVKQDTAQFRVGDQFRIVTIDLEPNDTLEKVGKMRQRYLDNLPEGLRASAAKGWTYLIAATPGDSASIRRVAKAVGFSYTYVADRAEWAHPAALIFLSVTGTVTRYVYGIEFDQQVMRESIIKAGTSEPATAVGFLNRCYHFDPDANNHSRAGVMALRIGAAGFAVLLLSALGVMQLIRRRRSGVNRA